MSDFTDEYQNLIIYQYQDKTKFIAEVNTLLNKLEEVKNQSENLLNAFDVDIAIGNQLDIIGRIVGMPRRINEAIPKVYFGFNDENPNAVGFGQAAFYEIGNSAYQSLDLNDSDYRFFIKLKIESNFMKNNIHEINKVVTKIFGGDSYIIDNKDMTFDFYAYENVESRLVKYAKILDLLPRPQVIEYNKLYKYYEDTTIEEIV